MRERDIMAAILLEAPKLNMRLYRNNSGVLKDARGQHVKFGLCFGSSDLIGWTRIGQLAIFTAIEVKQPGKRPTPQQAAFIKAVYSSGGIAFVATSVDDLYDHITAWQVALGSGAA